MCKKEGNCFYFRGLKPHRPTEGKMLRCFCCIPTWKLFTYVWQPGAIYKYMNMYIYTYKKKIKRHGTPVWVNLHSRTDVSISRCRRAGSRLCHHSSAHCRNGHLNSSAAVTLAQQYSTWGNSTCCSGMIYCDSQAQIWSLSMHHTATEPCTYLQQLRHRDAAFIFVFFSRRALLCRLNWM